MNRLKNKKEWFTAETTCLVLGAVSLPFSWIPGVAFVCFALSLCGALMGAAVLVVALNRKRKREAVLCVSGLLINLVGLAIATSVIHSSTSPGSVVPEVRARSY